jgi:hypothetical protein
MRLATRSSCTPSPSLHTTAAGAPGARLRRWEPRAHKRTGRWGARGSYSRVASTYSSLPLRRAAVGRVVCA